MSSVNNKAIKVLVVDDSSFMRKVITDILANNNGIEVAATARNGLEAIELAEKLKPDVITLDIEMPVMDGLSCLKALMEKDFIPVIMLSSLTKEGADCTIEALGYGAVDFITKPRNIFDMSGEEKQQEIVFKVKTAARLKGRKKTVAKIPIPIKGSRDKGDIKNRDSMLEHIVAIGTSTGGPKALQNVVPFIPGGIPAAFLIVQHMPPGFTKSLAERLDSISQIRVKEAEDGDIVRAGCAYIAPGGNHMLVEKLQSGEIKIKLSNAQPIGGHRPSVNAMMLSVSELELKNTIGVIMTGMGADGSEGIVNIKKRTNGYIIAQDEESCVVYGMPKMAVQTGVVDTVVPLNQISNEIIRIVGVRV